MFDKSYIQVGEYAKEDSPLSGLSLLLSPEQYASSAICFISQGSGGGYSPEKIAEKVKDSLYRQWEQYDPNMVNNFGMELLTMLVLLKWLPCSNLLIWSLP